jgi:hypothetical protein
MWIITQRIIIHMRGPSLRHPSSRNNSHTSAKASADDKSIQVVELTGPEPTSAMRSQFEKGCTSRVATCSDINMDVQVKFERTTDVDFGRYHRTGYRCERARGWPNHSARLGDGRVIWKCTTFFCFRSCAYRLAVAILMYYPNVPRSFLTEWPGVDVLFLSMLTIDYA